MGVYIKGMEMPKSCWGCPMVGGYELSDEVKARYSTLHCRLLRCKTPSGVKPNNCPLVPVPPHGRLIDGDYLKHTHCAECTLYPDKCLEKTEDGCDWGSIIHLRMCPTIIEAEGE